MAPQGPWAHGTYGPYWPYRAKVHGPLGRDQRPLWGLLPRPMAGGLGPYGAIIGLYKSLGLIGLGPFGALQAWGPRGLELNKDVNYYFNS